MSHALATPEPLPAMEAFRGLGGVQSYPSRTKDVDDVDFSTGSVGLGVGITAFASMVQDYVRARPDWAAGGRPEGRMIAYFRPCLPRVADWLDLP